jgi:predicted nucleic acid-binding protein
VGSVLLFPELLARPFRRGDDLEAAELAALLDRLELIPVDRELAQHSTTLAAKYKLRAIDATHLATAVVVGADRFITNNQKDFPKTISEVDVVYPADLPEVS